MNKVIQKLRDLANALEVLDNLGIDSISLLKPKTGRPRGPYKKEVKASTSKGYKYPKGIHWTQKAANKAKVRRVLRNAHLAMKEINKEKESGE